MCQGGCEVGGRPGRRARGGARIVSETFEDKEYLGFDLGFPMPQTRCLYLFSFTTQIPRGILF